MNERMNHSGTNPEDFTRPEQLTREAGLTENLGRKYAKSGDIFMPEGVDSEPPKSTTEKAEWKSDLLVNPRRPDAPFSAEVRREDLMNAWKSDYLRNYGSTVIPSETMQAIQAAVDGGRAPYWYTPGAVPGEKLQIPPHVQAQREEAQFREAQAKAREQTELLDLSGLTDDQKERLLEEYTRRNMSEYDFDNPMRNQPSSESRDKSIVEQVQPRHREKGYGGEIKISSAEALAEEIMKFDGIKTWGKKGVGGIEEDGLFPLLKEYVKDGVVQKVEGGEHNGETIYELNQENFMRWVRDRMMYWHDESSDSPYEFGSQVALTRDIESVQLQKMVSNASRYFRSEATGEVMEGLVEQIKKEVWLFGESRKTDIQYKSVMGRDEKLSEAIIQLFYGNTFTKTVWGGKSSLYWIMNLPDQYKETVKDADGKVLSKADSNLGRALNLAYHTYYNISDRETLVKLLGENAALLNPEEIRKTLRIQANEDGYFGKEAEDYVNPKDLKGIDDPDKLINFINIFNMAGKPTRITRAVQKLVQRSIAEKFDLYIEVKDKAELARMHERFNKNPDATDIVFDPKNPNRVLDSANVRYADTFALSMARWTGAAARNDVGAQGYDAWTRVQVTDEYRKKQPLDSRGGAFGNPYNINMMKQLGTDLLTGIQVQSLEKFDGKGDLVPKTALQVLDEMENATSQEEYDRLSAQLVFSDNTMRGFAQDHLGRAFTVYNQLQGAEEVKLDKFTSYDHINGLRFDRAGFEETIKEKFFKPMRYAYSTYGQINYGKIIRSPYNVKYIDEKGEEKTRVEYKSVRLAEAMFGRQILDGLNDIEHTHEGKPTRLYNKAKEHLTIDDPNWSDKINWEFVDSRAGKVALWRQVAIARLSAELYAHRDFHSTDARYNWWYYKEVIESLEMLPNLIEGDENDLKSSKAVGNFFKHEDLAWLKKASTTEDWRLYREAIITDIFKGGAEGFSKALKMFMEYAFKYN